MLENLLRKYQSTFHRVVPFKSNEDKLLKLDFTSTNTSLTKSVLNNTNQFSLYIEQQLQHACARYGIGGYSEHRTIYDRSSFFDSADGGESRRLHLGIDIWGKSGTPVFSPLGGTVHSFAFNNHLGDYGATVILLHQLDCMVFYTLYGHLSLDDIHALTEGEYLPIGEEFAHFGKVDENGQWPPHLHFQVINDIEFKKGDYPGVCKYSERKRYLRNCPDPDIILQMMRYAV